MVGSWGLEITLLYLCGWLHIDRLNEAGIITRDHLTLTISPSVAPSVIFNVVALIS